MPISSSVFVQSIPIPVPVPDNTECEELRKIIREMEKDIQSYKEQNNHLNDEIRIKGNYIQIVETKANEVQREYTSVNEELTAIKKILSH